ncbi:hypothetical protein [Pseudonocardia sp. D17]|uniref:hypothetical protein n=1 Tax=Pseudonocardia sp. D17 TaxID=882661 RepID=UPI002B3C1F22|nr:hypothetical protein PSD17_56530 [Pseudonocardia sp. D17]
MPWWGWLIAAVVAAVLLSWLFVNVFIVSTMRGVIRDDLADGVDRRLGRRHRVTRPDRR